MTHAKQALYLTAAAALLLFTAAVAAPPELLNYQGRLTDDLGDPLDGQFDLTFTINSENVGGIQLWKETQTVTISNGLFNVLLGTTNPLPVTVFDGNKAYLGIAINQQPELVPRQRIVSTAYAYRVATVDDAAGGTITSDLLVQGNLASTDSAFTNFLGVGSPSVDGVLQLFRDGSSNPIAELQPHSIAGGAELRLYDPSHNQAIYASHDASTGGGGFLNIARDDAGLPGFQVDGNFSGSNSPRMWILDDNTTMLFDTGVEGDSAVMLPVGTINAAETAHEAGISEETVTDNTALPDNTSSPEVLASQSIDCPTSGYVLAIGTAHLYFNNVDGFWGDVDFGLSTFTGTIEFGYKYTVRHQSAGSAGQEERIVTVHRVFEVEEGEEVINFLAKNEGVLAPSVLNAQLSLIYFPTWYGPRSVGATANTSEIDAIVSERVKEETARLEAQFEQRLQDLEAAIKEQQASNN